MSTSARLGVVGLMVLAILVARLIEVELATPLHVQVVAPPEQPEPEQAAEEPEVAEAGAPAPVAAPKPSERRYTVQKGDTLGKISKTVYGTSRLWKQIQEANKDVIPNPKRMKAGIELKIPPRDVGGPQ